MKVHEIVSLLSKAPQEAEFVVQHFAEGVHMSMPDTVTIATIISGEIEARPKSILVDTPIPGIPYWKECNVTPVDAVVLSCGAPETYYFE